MQSSSLPVSTRQENVEHFFVFFLLYFVQGIPYGLQNSYLPLYFRNAGMTLSYVGLFKLLMIPWLLKSVWAPFVDSYFTRKTWLNGCLLVLAVLCLVAALITPEYFICLAIVLFLFNVTTSIQDIALDSVMIESLHPSQLAQGNIAQVVGYKAGGLFAGGGMSVMSDSMNWSTIFFTLSATYMFGYFVSWLFLPQGSIIDDDDNDIIDQVVDQYSANTTNTNSGVAGVERPIIEDIDSVTDVTHNEEVTTERASASFQSESSASGSSQPNGATRRRRDSCFVLKIFLHEGTIWMIVFILFYKIGETGVVSMLPMFLLDNGVSMKSTGFWMGVVGQGLSIVGSIFGGVVTSGGLFLNMKKYLLIRGVSVLLIWLGLSLWSISSVLSYGICILGVLIVCFYGGALTTSTYTMMMHTSQKVSRRCRASHYSILTTADVLGRLLISSFVGGFTEWMGYSYNYMFGCFSVISFAVFLHMFIAPGIIRNN